MLKAKNTRSFKFFFACFALILFLGATNVRGTFTPEASYGELYENNAATVRTLPATANVFGQWMSSTVGEEAGIGFITGNAATDQLTVGSIGAGIYKIAFMMSFAGSTNTVYHIAIFKNNLETVLSAQRKIGASNDEGNVSGSGYLRLAVGDTIDLRAAADTASASITISHARIAANRIAN